MPGTFLTQTERDQLSTFPAVIPHWDLVTAFAVSEADRQFLDRYRTDANRLGVALQLCTLLQHWLVEHWDVSALNPNRQKFLARLGRKYTAQALRRMGPERRYPILLAFLCTRRC